MYKVVALKDTQTPEFFMAAIIVELFGVPKASARLLARQIHKKGNVCLGAFSHEIAEIKTDLANDISRHEGHPLTFVSKLMK